LFEKVDHGADPLSVQITSDDHHRDSQITAADVSAIDLNLPELFWVALFELLTISLLKAPLTLL
jgi:hypothetical protein